MTQMMRDLEAFVGLTPRQTDALETLRQRLLDAGKTRAQAQAQGRGAARWTGRRGGRCSGRGQEHRPRRTED